MKARRRASSRDYLARFRCFRELRHDLFVGQMFIAAVSALLPPP